MFWLKEKGKMLKDTSEAEYSSIDMSSYFHEAAQVVCCGKRG